MVASRDASAYFPSLTGLRGVAAAWVLAYHGWLFAGSVSLRLPLGAVALDFTPLFRCGYFGVDLFFVLSGFLLALPFHRAAAAHKARPSLRRFWMQRCRRVLPAYWLQLAILACVYFYLGRAALIDLHNLLAHALLVQNIVPWPVPLLNAVYWSMPVEWDFYVVLPLLAALLARCRWWLALGAVLIWVLAFRLACYESLFDPAFARVLSFGDVHQLPARLDQFFCGVLAAWLLVNKPQWLKFPGLLLLGGIGGIVAMAYVAAPRGDFLLRLDAPYLFFHHSFVAIAFAALVLGAACETRAGARLFANAPLTFLGLISYSLYLWHYPLLQLAQGLGWLDGARAPAWVIVLCAAVPAILLIAWPSYRYVERPFLIAASPFGPRIESESGAVSSRT
jgi:peptidoglycan/LPS O-acetylase OafA/YrhL